MKIVFVSILAYLSASFASTDATRVAVSDHCEDDAIQYVMPAAKHYFSQFTKESGWPMNWLTYQYDANYPILDASNSGELDEAPVRMAVRVFTDKSLGLSATYIVTMTQSCAFHSLELVTE